MVAPSFRGLSGDPSRVAMRNVVDSFSVASGVTGTNALSFS
jgi:hypothetical protein